MTSTVVVAEVDCGSSVVRLTVELDSVVCILEVGDVKVMLRERYVDDSCELSVDGI